MHNVRNARLDKRPTLLLCLHAHVIPVSQIWAQHLICLDGMTLDERNVRTYSPTKREEDGMGVTDEGSLSRMRSL